MKIRTLTNKDIPQLKKIWKDTFDDPMYFVDWYFDHRFFPDHSACACDGDRIVSVCHTMPTAISIRSRSIPCALLNGVATLPEYRGRGLMKQVITFLYELLPPMGICLLPNTPADLRIYAPCGHYPNTTMTEPDRAEQHSMPEDIRITDISHSTDKTYELFSRIAPTYSGMILRTKEEHLRKCSEYILDDCKVLLHKNGYAIFYDTETACACPEIIAQDAESYSALTQALFAHAYPRNLRGRFPQEAFPEDPAIPRSVLGIMDVEKFLATLQLKEEAVIHVTDNFYPKNNGTYLLNGTRTDAEPQIVLSISALAQWLSGYCNLEETDAEIRTELSLPKKQRCFTNDDY